MKKLLFLAGAIFLIYTYGLPKQCGNITDTLSGLPENTESLEQTVKDTVDKIKEQATDIADSVNKLLQNDSEKEETSADNTSDAPYTTYNNNIPEFTEVEKATGVFEIYSELDSLGRCGVAFANVCKELMPTEERGEIGSIKPTGWHTVKYPDVIADNYLYNRCHLIAFCLAGENANEKNLITGTRYMNVEGMLPFEIKVADYIDNNPNNHVLYRVTPVFEGDNLVASGVKMEAWSIEDAGAGICFNIFVPNIQPGIEIDYKTGASAEK